MQAQIFLGQDAPRGGGGGGGEDVEPAVALPAAAEDGDAGAVRCGAGGEAQGGDQGRHAAQRVLVGGLPGGEAGAGVGVRHGAVVAGAVPAYQQVRRAPEPQLR